MDLLIDFLGIAGIKNNPLADMESLLLDLVGVRQVANSKQNGTSFRGTASVTVVVIIIVVK